MAVNLDKCVTKGAVGYDVVCPITDGTCGKRAVDDTPAESFTSRGWPTRAVARARLDEHIADHRGEAPASSLDEFRAKHGLTVNANGDVVTLADLS